MFLSKEKYDNIMLQLCRIRTEISTKDECGEACRMCDRRGQPRRRHRACLRKKA